MERKQDNYRDVMNNEQGTSGKWQWQGQCIVSDREREQEMEHMKQMMILQTVCGQTGEGLGSTLLDVVGGSILFDCWLLIVLVSGLPFPTPSTIDKYISSP